MAQRPKETKQPAVIDPDNVKETLCEGRFYFHPHGRLGTLTFTHEQPNANAMFESNDATTVSVVRARITMSIEKVVALRDLLNSLIKRTETPVASAVGGGERRH